jgi:hypothetical protein
MAIGGGTDGELPSPWEELVAKGKERGWVAMDDVFTVFAELTQIPPSDLRPAVELFNWMGIDVLAERPG